VDGISKSGILVSESKRRQSAKLREIAVALEADGFIGLDAQATALGLSRSTAWTILNGSHKHSGLTAATLNRMLAAPLLGNRARAKILEYIAEKRAGHYGVSKLSLRRFEQRLKACPPSLLALRGLTIKPPAAVKQPGQEGVQQTPVESACTDTDESGHFRCSDSGSDW